MLSIFKPAPHKARLPAAEIDPTYRRLRWQIFLGIFFGYAAYYLVRKNFALAMPYLVEQGFSRGDLGNSSWVRYRIARIRAFSCPQV